MSSRDLRSRLFRVSIGGLALGYPEEGGRASNHEADQQPRNDDSYCLHGGRTINHTRAIPGDFHGRTL